MEHQNGPQFRRTISSPYSEQQRKTAPQTCEAECVTSLKRLRRKADWHIVPLTFLCYLLNLIDKVAYNVSEHITKPCFEPPDSFIVRWRYGYEGRSETEGK